MDAGFCAWQFSQTPDSLACSPAAAASSGLYWVTLDPPSKKTSSLLSSSLTLSKPMAACSAMNARTASGPVSLGCGPSGPICTGLLSRSNEAARIRGPGGDLVAQEPLRGHRRQRSGRVHAGEPVIEHDQGVPPGDLEVFVRRRHVVEEADVERRVERRVDVPERRGKGQVAVRVDQAGHDGQPGAVDHLITWPRLGAAA